MITYRPIYNKVCQALLEPGGLVLGIVTVQEFLDAAYVVTQDFLQKAGLQKKIAALPQLAGQGIFVIPDWILDVQEVFYDERALTKGEQGDWDRNDPSWRTRQGPTPQSWAQDRTTMKKVMVTPQAVVNGDQVDGSPAGFYGTISIIVAGAIDPSVTAPWLGTLSSGGDEVYLEAAGPFLGTISSLVEARTNITVIGSVGVFNSNPGLDSIVEGVPASFSHYISYGILSKIFSKDGESKDDQKAMYCSQRFEEGTTLAKTLVEELENK